MKKYDSTVDTKLHILNMKKIAEPISKDFLLRILQHDKSKLESPEKECYDALIPQLKEHTYGSPGYFRVKKEMEKTGLAHHYQENRHHPEHFKNQIHDMNLVDILEMLCDWYAASMRSDTGFEEGFKKNIERFHISKDLEEVLWNTYLYYIRGKVKK